MSTLADAALDKRVALADAQDRYERAMLRAAEAAAVAETAANVQWQAAKRRARESAVARRRQRARYRAQTTAYLLGELETQRFRLSPYVTLRTPEMIRAAKLHAGMIARVLESRGVAVPDAGW